MNGGQVPCTSRLRQSLPHFLSASQPAGLALPEKSKKGEGPDFPGKGIGVHGGYVQFDLEGTPLLVVS